jgi:hypothetical protein
LGTIYNGSKGIFSVKWVDNLLLGVLKQSRAVARIESTEAKFYKMKKSSKMCTKKLNTLLTRITSEKQIAVAQDAEEGLFLPTDIEYDVWTIVDPSGGVGVSEYAIISILFYDETCVLVGMTSLHSKNPTEHENMISTYFKKLRSHPSLQNATQWVGVESNFGGSLLVNSLLKYNIQPAVHFKQIVSKEGVDGIVTTQNIKYNGVIYLSELLHYQKLKFAQHMVWYGRPNKHLLLKEFERQMLDFTYTNGKFSGKQSGKNDDIIIALILCLHWSRVKTSDETIAE